MSKWSEWKENLGDARPWHLLDPSRKINDQSIIDERLSLCLGCDKINQLTKQCTLCLCYMPAKTTLALAECPIHKWGKEE